MSSETARALFSVNFGEKNTWDDWCLIPIRRPVIDFPAVKTNIVDITGGDGQIDLLQILVDTPVYKNRTGSLLFRMVDKVGELSVLKRKNEIARYLHGYSMNMVLDEEPEYYYTGRFEIDNMAYKGNGDIADITITYDIEPYKYGANTADRWLWDPFSLETGIIYDGLIVNATVNSLETPIVINDFNVLAGDVPVRPVVTVSNNLTNIFFKRMQYGTWEGIEYEYKTGTDVQPAEGPKNMTFNRHTDKIAIRGFGKFTLAFTPKVV